MREPSSDTSGPRALHFSLADLPPTRRFAAFHDALATRNPPVVMTPVTIEQDEDEDVPLTSGL